MAQRILTWTDVDALLEHLIPQFYGSYDAMLMISRGGIIPGGMIAERLDLGTVLTAAIQFPDEEPHELRSSIGDRVLPPFASSVMEPKPTLGLPSFRQFPDDVLLRGRRTLVVQHIWNHGRTINAAAGRVEAAGGAPELCVLHYKPTRSIFPNLKPDYYAAITDDFIIYPWEVQRNLSPYRPMPKPT